MAAETTALHQRLVQGMSSVGLALALFLVFPIVGQAHSNLERSDPADGMTFNHSPVEARLWFTEELEPEFTRAVAFDARGQPISTDSKVAPDDPRLLVVSLQPTLARGWYTVEWQAQAKVDGHLTRGSITFGIDVTGPPPAIVGAASSAETGSGSTTDVALRWAILLSAIVLVGSFSFWLMQGSVSGMSSGRRDATRIRPGQWAVAELAWLTFLLANVVFLANAASAATDATSLDDLGAPLVQLATQTTYGQLWVIRMILASVVGLILLDRGTSVAPARDAIALGLGGGMLLCISLSSHSGALPSLASLAVANDWLHLASVTLWVGGVTQVAVLLAAGPERLLPIDAPEERWLVARHFAAIAPYLLALVVVSGLVEAVNHVPSLSSLLTSAYGQVVLIKAALLLPLLAIAAGHRPLIRSLLTDQAGDPLPILARFTSIVRAEALLNWSVRYEALWLSLLIALAGLLTSLSPPP